MRSGRCAFSIRRSPAITALELPNVTIMPNAIVAVGAVATSDVPESSVARQIPARTTKSLETGIQACGRDSALGVGQLTITAS
jgi:hypothetical protein